MFFQRPSCFPCGSDGKESTWNAGDLGLILGLGRSPGEGKGYPLQYSCLDNSMDRGAWKATVHEAVWLRWLRICLPCGRSGFDPWVGKIPWRRAWQPTLVFLFGESPWTEEPGSYGSWGRKEVFGAYVLVQVTEACWLAFLLLLSTFARELFTYVLVRLGFSHLLISIFSPTFSHW